MTPPHHTLHSFGYPGKRARPLVATLAIAALALAATGCGGSASSASSSSSASTPTNQPTGEAQPPAVLAQANHICERVNREFDAERPSSAKISEITRVTPHRAAVEMQAVRELGALTPPAQLAGDFRRVVAYRRMLALELAQLARAAKAKNTHAIHALAASKKRVHAKLRALAQQVGLAACGKTG